MKFVLVIIVLDLMTIAGSQRVVPAGSNFQQTVVSLQSESNAFHETNDNIHAIATHYPRPEYPLVPRFYPIAGSTMLIGYPLITGRGGINGHGGYGRVIPIRGYSYGR
ncbi:uncharacterized protein LOC130701075 [Daphnia carinata]|uniref:uncharacterized protein LOC130701075 n=1 Tax=Daphnia carinata TaxID=120202 RepID=UPI00257B90EE|nr:uncharacterized protein LOC130701075 [Daphnia carinata]